jgi:hypothetical protein
MKKISYLLVVFLLLIAVWPTSMAKAQDQTPPQPEPESGGVICPPGVYNDNTPNGCLPLGPSETLTQNNPNSDNASLFNPLYHPDFALNYVPFNYFRVSKGGTMIYPSQEAASTSSGAINELGPGFVYVSYNDMISTAMGVVFNIEQGWIRGDGSRVTPGIFQGFAMSATPRTPFGWVITETNSRKRPEYTDSNPTIKTYPRFSVLTIYELRTVDGYDWYRIGTNEWVEGHNISAVFPNPIPPEGVTNGRWIDVNLAEQNITVYDNNQMVYATMISSGVEPFWTRPGLFKIYEKKDTENMSGSFEADRSDFYYLQNVPWTMYFDKARALHGAYWHTLFGYPQSHGCVNLSLGDSNWLYHWAQVGDWVWVHDPSGMTPTDPAKYGEGGA